MKESCYHADFMAQGQISGTSDAQTAQRRGQETLSNPGSSEQSLRLPAEITDSFCQMMFETGPVKWIEGLETRKKKQQ